LKKTLIPRRFSIFFSKAQKEFELAERNPINTNKTWYSGKIISNLVGVCNQVFFQNTQPKTNWFYKYADVEPVTAKTINIITSWKLDSMPQRFFNAFAFCYCTANVVTLSGRNIAKSFFFGILKVNK
jgi:hypothetical protein